MPRALDFRVGKEDLQQYEFAETDTVPGRPERSGQTHLASGPSGRDCAVIWRFSSPPVMWYPRHGELGPGVGLVGRRPRGLASMKGSVRALYLAKRR